MATKTEHPECEHCKVRYKSVFCDLNKDELESISAGKGCTTYKKGQIIFHENAFPLGLYCVNSGKIKIYQLGEQGRDQIVRLAKEGDVLGYRALLSGQSYACGAAAIDDASICFIPKDIVFNVLDKNMNLSMGLIKLLSHDLEKAEHKITNLAQKPVRERMAETLLFIKGTYGFEDDGKTLNAILTREELANITGTATETAIRLLSEFKQDKIIELEGKKIKILDIGKLATIARIED